MGRFSALCAAAIAVIVATGFGGTAYAITTFAQLYKMKCDACHTTVPKLNEFGAAFMAKGFVLPSQDGGEKQGDKLSPKGEVAGTSDAGRIKGKEPGNVGDSEAKDTGVAGTGSKESTGEETTKLPVVEPPPPTVVYKIPSRDGSIHFTDNPDRGGKLVSDQETLTGEGEPGASRKPLFPNKKQTVRIPPPVHQTVKKSIASAEKKPERYRNYAECMERQLDGTAQPESAQEIMDLFVTAEKKCASYQTGKKR
jgi:hypothetical protein